MGYIKLKEFFYKTFISYIISASFLCLIDIDDINR